MILPRISILGMFALVAILAVLIAAFIYATPLWEDIVFTLLVAVLFTALVLAICRPDERRAFWVGFCVFGWGYATMVFAPWFDQNVGPNLLTSDPLLRPLHSWIDIGRAARAAEPGFTPVRTSENYIQIGPRAGWDVWGATWERSRRIGNSAGALLWAVVGGILAQSIRRLNQKQDSSAVNGR
jgi:hypothetical protein